MRDRASQKTCFFSQKTLKEEVIALIIRFRRARLYLRFIDDRKNADLLYIYLFSHHLYYNKQYFVSSGFAFAHADSSVDILAVEAVPVEHLDETVVRKMLSEHTAKFQAAKDDYEKATHQIGIDVSTAMVSAIETMGK